MKKYVSISGLNLKDNNRGTAALGYGSLAFLQKKGMLHPGQQLVNYRVVLNPFKKGNRGLRTKTIEVDKIKWEVITVNVSKIVYHLFLKWGILLPFTQFRRSVRQIELVAAINGGDGFSDIYDTKAFLDRLTETMIAMRANIPLVLLPQTIGPFKESTNYQKAFKILHYASKVYVRDDKFVDELKKEKVAYEEEKDLSCYMAPEPWEIEIAAKAIGINVSGLAYSNKFRTLAGQFDHYPDLIERLVCTFRDMGHTIYLIPHSYNYQTPEANNDDLEACRLAYSRLANKEKVHLVERDMTPPQVKYLISKMSFFIGTRMHANFAAIFTGTPLFGLAYSYKFAGAFEALGLDSSKQTTIINNITSADINPIVNKIVDFYDNVSSRRL